MNKRPRRFFQEAVLFRTLIFLDFLFYLFLILTKRLPMGHDGFIDLSIMYYFLNGAVQYGEIPQWVPYCMHGISGPTVFIMHYVTGVFFNVLLLLAPVLKEINFLPLFYIGLFVDEMILTVGVWLLAKRYFKSPFTLFFVSCAAVFSIVPLTDISNTLRFFYAIPLILHYLHTFSNTQKWRYCFLAGYLYIFQALTTAVYFIPVTSLVIAAYFIFYMLFNVKEVGARLKGIQFGKGFVFWMLLLALIAAHFYFFLHAAERELTAVFVSGRNADSTVSLETFLTYGGRVDLGKFRELFLRSSKELELTLYSGLITLTFAVFSLIAALRRRNLHFYAVTGLIMLLSSGTIVAQWLYYGWPLMKYYRHIGLIDGIAKMFLCFLAGFGFEAYVINRLSLKRWQFIIVSLLLSAGMVGAYFGITSMIGKYPQAFRMQESGAYALVYAVFFFVFGFLKSVKRQQFAVILLLFIHTTDTYSYKITEGMLRSFPLNQQQYEVFNFEPIAYARVRGETPAQIKHREIILDTPAGKEIDRRAMSWRMDAFLFRDVLAHEFRTDFASKHMDDYLRALTSNDLNAAEQPYGYYSQMKIYFPDRESVYKISGATSLGKIQFFKNAYAMEKRETVASILAGPTYKADVLLLTIPDNISSSLPKSVELSSSTIKANERIKASYEVFAYSPGSLALRAQIPKEYKTAFLYYADVWHNQWSAYVNGKKVPVYEANLAYKAVALAPGDNEIIFRFFSPYVAWLYIINNLNGLFWFLTVLYLMIFAPKIVNKDEAIEKI